MKPCVLRHNMNDALNILSCVKPDRILVTAKSSSGKSYFAQQLQTRGYHVIETDKLVEKLLSEFAEINGYDKNDLELRNFFFGLYGAETVHNRQFRQDFVKLIHDEFDRRGGGLPVIVDGAIKDVALIHEIFTGKFANFTLVYLYPTSIKRYYDRLYARTMLDLQENKHTLPFWEEIAADMRDAMEERYRTDGKLLPESTAVLKKHAREMTLASRERYSMLLEAGLSVYRVNV